jgi:putative zinc finger protein
MSHPEPETLAAYHAGELTAEDERRLQDHLLECRECSDLLLDLEGLADPGFGAGSLSATDQEALWDHIQGEIKKEERPAPVVPLRRPAPSVASPRWLQALAASLLVATVGLSTWVVSLRHELSRPQANAKVIQLSTGSVRSGTSSRLNVVPADAPRRFILLLHLAGPGRAARYRAEIVRAEGGKVSDVQGLALDEELDAVSLELSRDEIGPGDYRVRLFPSPGKGAPEDPVAEYPLHVEPPRREP